MLNTEKLGKMSLITTPLIHHRDDKQISFVFMFDSEAPIESISGYDAWGIFEIKKNSYVIQIIKNNKMVMGGGIGTKEKGFYEEYIKDLPNTVFLVRESDHQVFKEILEKYFEVVVFKCKKELLSGSKIDTS